MRQKDIVKNLLQPDGKADEGSDGGNETSDRLTIMLAAQNLNKSAINNLLNIIGFSGLT